MNTTDKENKNIEKEIKIPFFIPIIIVIIIGLLMAKNDIFKTVAKEEPKNIEESIMPVISPEDLQEGNKDVETVTYTAGDGKKYDVIATLNIPTLGINYPILSTTSEALLKVALNRYWGANPNEVGNMVVLGHNYENTKFFSKLNKINIGDIVQITDLSGRTLDYEVYDTFIIAPDDNDCTSQLTNGHTEITLITCHNRALQRFVVKARAK